MATFTMDHHSIAEFLFSSGWAPAQPERGGKVGTAIFIVGSTRWQMIRRVVVPAAVPGILTEIVLGLARAFNHAGQ